MSEFYENLGIRTGPIRTIPPVIEVTSPKKPRQAAEERNAGRRNGRDFGRFAKPLNALAPGGVFSGRRCSSRTSGEYAVSRSSRRFGWAPPRFGHDESPTTASDPAQGQSFSSYTSDFSGNGAPQIFLSGSRHSAPICFSEEPSQAVIQTTRNWACVWWY